MDLKSFHEKRKSRQEKVITRLDKKNILRKGMRKFLIGVGKIFISILWFHHNFNVARKL